MPKDSEKERKERDVKMQEGYKAATLVPLRTVEFCMGGLGLCKSISQIMDESMASDVGSGALMANAGAKAAAYNVMINLKSITDEDFCNETNKKLESMTEYCDKLAEEVAQNVEKTL